MRSAQLQLQLPEALWAKLDSVLHELADGELDAMDEEDFEMALHLTGADAGPAAERAAGSMPGPA